LPRSAGGFALAVAIVYFVFFAFNKQAFVQYYYFVIGALCCALAVWETLPAQARTPAVPTTRAQDTYADAQPA
jgi:4-amino-4-deoxy-L-arabinose transferase-like glycosyltransferase